MAMGEMADLNLPPVLTQDSRMLILPYEIVFIVRDFLPLHSWNALVQTCRHFYNAFMPSLYSITIKNDQRDVFKWAAGKGRLATIHRLLDYAPNGYFNCVRGEAALREAAWAGQTDIVRWLLDSGVDPYCTQTRTDKFESCVCKNTAAPVLLAAWGCHTEATKLLLDATTDFNYVRSLEESPVIVFVRKKETALLKEILGRGIDVDQRDMLGRTALFHAVINEHISGVRLLLEFGADINATDARQDTPLCIAAQWGLEAVVELLLQRGARVDMPEYARETSLHVAISTNSIKGVSLLIELGANVNAIDSSQETALQRSLSDWIEPGILKLLLDAGADFTVPNIHGNTPVKRALMSRAKEKVRLLLKAIEARGASSDLPESPTTLLHAAIFAQHGLAYRLLAQGADVDKRESATGLTALLEAAKQEQDGLFDLVLQNSLDVNARGSCGQTALSFAAKHGSEHKVRSLLKRNASVDALLRYWTPSAYATKNHHLQVVLLLLRQTKGVDLSDDFLPSAVTSAVTFDDEQCLEFLLEKGKLDQPDRSYGYTVLHHAARRGDLAVVKWLLNRSVGVDAAGYDKRTPLMLAVYSRNDAVVEQLLQHGARLDAPDTHRATALHWALPDWADPSLEISNCNSTLWVDLIRGLPVNSNIVRMLVEAGADLEAKNSMDETPLARAAINGSASAVRLLLEKGANVESRDKWGFVPLLLAAEKGHTAVVCLLLEYGASIESANADGNTALMLAADNGHHETILSLLARSAEINRVNHDHRTALSCAAAKGHDKVVKILLQYGAEVDLPDHTGRTPLLWAVQNEHKRCVELLVQGCADVTRGDIEGRTPLWWAWKRDQRNSLKRLDAVIRILYNRHPAANMTNDLHQAD
ncbi:hypothetical protein Aspvir_009421 [Aspergillus viridinutans]|uniref:Ankyrin repeat protein n=1 Tax=Aspergillus viridinutans TaxID=75553 RepID=A0A9P3BYE7_ASPVI|nr:uncharacterized protein Aspvir_009421 [Aspergillus viridinutans]GIK05315.1 hypothetical protein Aspvir_009421 [Aspergillus viridinutans]